MVDNVILCKIRLQQKINDLSPSVTIGKIDMEIKQSTTAKLTTRRLKDVRIFEFKAYAKMAKRFPTVPANTRNKMIKITPLKMNIWNTIRQAKSIA